MGSPLVPVEPAAGGPLADQGTEPVRPAPWDRALLGLALLGTLLLAAWQIPGINEPHYLGKSRHYWDASFCPGDFFYDSPYVHLVFYQTLGLLAWLLPLPAAALLGRLICLALLASGWWRLGASWSLTVPERLAIPCLYALLTSAGTWSGEWVLGGCESKVVAYGLLLHAAAWLSGPFPRSDQRSLFRATCAGAIACGLAIALHPLVGLWTVLAALCVAVVAFVVRRDGEGAKVLRPPRSQGVAGTTWIAASVLLLATAAWGLVPALALLAEPLDPGVKFQANFIQVFYRLAHHVDAMQFGLAAHVWGVGLVVLWGALWFTNRRSTARRGLHLLTLASLLFALAGVLIAWGPRPPQTDPTYQYGWRMALLRFYPFRLVDAVLPLTISVELVGCLQHSRWWRDPAAMAARWLTGALLIAAVLTGLLMDWPTGALKTVAPGEWTATCDWIRQHTPSDSVCITPGGQSDFKWRAERTEYVSFKDCPQDAQGIVEWNRRLRLLSDCFSRAYDDRRYSPNDLWELRELTGADWLIVDRLGPIDQAPVFQAGSVRVYDLREMPH